MTESPLYYPDMQFKYGQGGNGAAPSSTTVEDSWGPVVNAGDHTKSFFQTGLTATTSVSLTGGTDKAQTYFSYGNTSGKGIVPTSDLMKHTLNLRETANFFQDRLTVDANVLFLSQKADNRPVSGLYANPLTGLYLFPRGLDFNKYKNYQYFSPTRNMNLQNWFDIYYDNMVAGVLTPITGQDHEQNPYWLLNNAPHSDKRDRAFTNLSLKYKLADWLTLQARGNFDKSIDTYEGSMAAGTQAVQSAPNGRYTYDRAINTQMYGDVILTGNKALSRDIDLQATLGSSITDAVTEQQSFDTDPNTTQGLYYANKFGVNYITADALISNSGAHAPAANRPCLPAHSLDTKGFLFVDLTARNDWSSTFAFTPHS